MVHKRRFGLHWPALWAECAGTLWDLVVDLRGSAFSFLVPARRRAIMRGGRRPGHRLLHLAETLRLSPAPRPVAWWTAEDEARVAPLLPSPSGFLILAPTASQRVKMWPAERFAALARALTAPDGPLPGAAIGVIAGPGERERQLAAPLLAALPGARDLIGNLPIPEAAALLSRAGLFVGNDSGLMHLAAAAGAPPSGCSGPRRPANTPRSDHGRRRCWPRARRETRRWCGCRWKRRWRRRGECWRCRRGRSRWRPLRGSRVDGRGVGGRGRGRVGAASAASAGRCPLRRGGDLRHRPHLRLGRNGAAGGADPPGAGTSGAAARRRGGGDRRSLALRPADGAWALAGGAAGGTAAAAGGGGLHGPGRRRGSAQAPSAGSAATTT